MKSRTSRAARRLPTWHGLRIATACLLLGIAAVPAASLGDVLHPCTIMTPGDVEMLRLKVHDGGDDDLAWAEMLARWPKYRDAPLDSLADVLGGSTILQELGLLSQLEDPSGEVRQFGRLFLNYIAQTREPTEDEYTTSLRLRALALGYDLLYMPALPNDLAPVRDEILAYLASMQANPNCTRYIYNPYVSNKGMMVGGAMGLAAIAIWDEVEPSQRAQLAAALDLAAQLVDKCLSDMLAGDGSYREGVLYGAWTLRMLIPYLEARRRFDGQDLGEDPRLPRVAEWLAYEILPEGGGRTNNINNSPWVSRPLAVHSTYLAWAQSRYSSSLAAWLFRHVVGEYGISKLEHTDRVATVLWNRPLPEIDPAAVLTPSRFFDKRGIYFYRSSWKDGAQGTEMLFTLHAGRFYGGHAQEDQGQFTLRAFGEKYVLDNGPAYPTQKPKESESHNIVLIDGVGQHNAGNSIGTDAVFVRGFLNPCVDALHTDLDSAYATHSPFNDPDQPVPGTDWSWGYDGNPVERATRRVLVVKDPAAPTWFLVADDFRKDAGTHRWEWLLHTDRGNSVQVNGGVVDIAGVKGHMNVVFAHPMPPQLQVVAEPYDNEGEDPTTTRIRAGVDAVEPRFAVALLPLPPGAIEPQATSTQESGMTLLRLDWGSVVDHTAVVDAGGGSSASLVTDGRIAFVREIGSQVRRWMLFEGTSLRFESTEIVTLDAPASVAFAGPTLHLDRSDVRFRAYAPQVDEVLAPGGPVPFVRRGHWVESARTTSVGPMPTGPRTVVAGNESAVRIDCIAPTSSGARIAIHDVRGRLVRALWMPAGGTAEGIDWDRRDASGRWVGAGIYFVRAPECTSQRLERIVVVR